MAAASEVQVYLGLEEFFPAPKSVESDSDSGQGSCGMVCSSELGRMENLDDGDSDEEIVVSKKSKNKKVVLESDSEAEVMDTTRNEDEESGEENKENVSGLKGKHRRICSAPLDSEDSDREDQTENVKTSSEHPTSKDTSALKQKKSRKSKKQDVPSKLKSKRRTEKAEKRMVSIGKLKKEKKKSEMLSEEERPLLNDSGCLLANGDLFENEVGDAIDPVDEEESLDAIRAKVTDKFKGRSYADYDGSDPEQEFGDEPDHGGKRKERKAARMSKEAMKQLHSETQRLIRESLVSMPYHLPEPKTIHDFFKRRQRPSCQGNVMHLIKSSKYQPFIAEERTNTHVNKATEVEKTGSDPTVEPTIDINRLCQAPSDTDTVDQEETKQIDAEEECEPMTVTDNPDTSSKTSPCEDQKESILETEEHAENIVGVIPQENCHPHAVNKDGETDENNGSSSSTTAPIQRLPKLSKLEKLRALGVDLSLKPRLCPDDGTFVNLDDPQPNKELEALKQRFLKHSLHKAKPVVERKINITVVHKETTADGKEELKADVVPVTMAGEKEEQIHAKPGEKLLVLKAKLQEAMKVRRSEERQKRQALFNLDNEDGFNDDEEEAEMTDSDEEEEGNAETAEYLLGQAEEEDEDSLKHDELEKDGTEASLPVSSMATESTLMLFKDHSTKLGDSLPDKIDNGDCKGIGKLEEEDSLLTKENSHNSSFELIGSMIPSYQPFNKNARGSLHSSIGGFRSPSPMHFKTSFLSSASKSSGKMSEPSLPVEDSQDLYNASPEPKAYLCPGGESQFRFSLEDDTQSQLLDADGFLNVGHHRSKYSSAKQRLAMDTMDENAMDANMGELLDLCSGQFHVSSQVAKESKAGAMEELLGLCSGTFVSQAKTSTQICSPSKSQSPSQNNDAMSTAAALCSSSFTVEREDEDEEEEEEFGEFQLLPCDDLDSEQDEGNDGENEGSDDEKEASDEDEEEVLRQQQKTKKLRLKDFMENEAELSGSDNGSGDEEEGDEDDEYEEDSIDEELPSDEDLQDQVNKIHMKVTMDEDKRRLRLYQERYLADGDLHSDGPGRMRKYRWKMFDDASQLDMFRRDSELEDQEVDNEELDEAEIKWRKERFEREQWMREQSESRNVPQEEEEDIGEDSQFMKLAKKVTAKALQRRATTESKELKKPVSRNPFEVMRTFSNPKMQTGSLLNKPKEVLQKLAAMSNVNPNAPRNSRNFVFQTLSPAKKEPSDRPKPKVRKNIALTTPSPKRFKPGNTSNGNSRSIFPFLEN